ncbi:MAG: hypothetical protein HYV27_08625 [Candidatus Hydrogenedentes bacterium]|nr:hypothetical protein [Candidatus Hydrogenedentota bacterium]
MNAIVALMFFSILAAPAGPAIEKFDIGTPVGDGGGKVTLEWNVPEATSVYITNVGKVENTGKLEVDYQPELKGFALVAESEAGVNVQAEAYTLGGTRGNGLLHASDFSHGYPYSFVASELTTLQDTFQAVLKNSGFEVFAMWDLLTERMIFVTMPLVANGVFTQPGDAIRARRVAFWVSMPKETDPEGKCKCELKARVEYKLEKEKNWRVEPESTYYKLGTDWLNGQIVRELERLHGK